MTTTEIATNAGSALAIANDQTNFTPQQIAALKQLGVDEATDGDLQVFFHQCQRTGLDPFARQIYMIGRRQKDWNPRTREETWSTKYTIQTGIDGFRLIASRTGQLDGYEDTLWCGEDGKWTDVWLKREAPAASKVTVIRNGARYPAVALFTEYAGLTNKGELTKMWREKGALMLAKCAEALALRKAFPQDLSGLYTSDEMQQANNGQESAPAPQRQRQQSQRPTSIAEALAPEPVAVDMESLMDAAALAGTYEALLALWDANVANLTEEQAEELKAFMKARKAQLAAESEPEPANEPTLDDAIDAEVVA
ncbi:phage recombination protein Bet [Rhodococcus hoagii]|nr:phage recombination protein Bet [Prescottella equi]NKR80043.1 phage recombination protein Bet [Prescottella equi]NKT01840.1 phage recombination protein Bet [Prescottella equi]